MENVRETVDYFSERGYEVVHGPEEISVGSVATIRNEWGHEFDVLDFQD
ncbi:hypothetical protein [Haladaptatus halobius]|nr:hypothetical protein [Haladaptatus halobius]